MRLNPGDGSKRSQQEVMELKDRLRCPKLLSSFDLRVIAGTLAAGISKNFKERQKHPDKSLEELDRNSLHQK